MNAIVCRAYGPPDVLRLEEMAKPTPREDEALIAVHAASVNARHWRLKRADPFMIRLTGQGFLKPKKPILGVDVAGRVEAVGTAVRQLRPGDEVFGFLSRHRGGTFAESVYSRANGPPKTLCPV
jgi:NADPH:quinone reductase-like Zn-dependent oxidoreductase